jgi:hypothetical protein
MLVDMSDDMGEVGLVRDQQARAVGTDPLGTHRDLLDALLTGHVQGTPAGALGDGVGDHQQQGALAGPGLPGQQQDLAGDQATAYHAVELGDAGLQSLGRLAGGDLGDRAGTGRAAAPCREERSPALGVDPWIWATVPNSPHLAQRPVHLTDIAPQALQAYAGADLAIDA